MPCEKEWEVYENAKATHDEIKRKFDAQTANNRATNIDNLQPIIESLEKAKQSLELAQKAYDECRVANGLIN